MKILSQVYPWTRKYPLNSGSNQEYGSRVRVRIQTADPDHTLLGGRGRMQSLDMLLLMLVDVADE